MSLISLRNLAGPLGSKLQMGALAIAVILVLVIRFGTAKSSSGDAVRADRSAGRASGSQDLLEVLKEARKPGSGAAAKAKDPLLDGLVAEGLDREPQDQEASEPSQSEAFEDIRKSLGLE